MYALIAAVPILLTVIFMVGFNWPAKRALPVSWLIACLIGGIIWKMGVMEMAAQTIAGFLSAFETISIIFGAILLMNVLKKAGAMATINNIFSGITKDARYQAVLVGFLFGGFIEGVAGFGTPAALAAPILISLGFPPLAAATVALIYNSTPVCPGPVGVPTITAANTVADAVKNLGGDPDTFLAEMTKWTVIPHLIGGIVIIFVGVAVLCKLFGKNRSFKDALSALPFCLFSGVVLGVIYIPMAIITGAELTSMTAFMGTLVIDIIVLKMGWFKTKDTFVFDGFQEWGDKAWQSTTEVSLIEDKGVSPVKAWMPYVVIGLLLVISRIPAFGVRAILNNEPLIIHVTNILGFENINWNFKYLWNAGWFPFVPVALLSLFFFRVPTKEMMDPIKESFKQIAGATVALLFGVAMVNIYRYTANAAIGATVNAGLESYTYVNSSMLYMMAQALASLFKGMYFIIAPLIGVLGSFMSGSCTVSNTLFSSLQFETATLVALPQVLIVALQNMGGAIGNMVCVNNIVSACATTGTNGNEGRLIKSNIIPCLIYCVVVAAVVGILLAAGVHPMPELLASM